MFMSSLSPEGGNRERKGSLTDDPGFEKLGEDIDEPGDADHIPQQDLGRDGPIEKTRIRWVSGEPANTKHTDESVPRPIPHSLQRGREKKHGKLGVALTDRHP